MQGEQLRFVALSGQPYPADLPVQAMPIDGTSAMSQAITERRLVEVPDVLAPDAPAFSRNHGSRLGFRSVVGVPLCQGNIFKASLLLVSKESTKPMPDKDMRMVIDLADRVGVVISHAELFATVERQAVTDAMTGLFNRRYFEEQLTKEIDRFQRFGHHRQCSPILWLYDTGLA